MNLLGTSHLNSILQLMLQSDMHKGVSMRTFARIAVPPLHLAQCALWYDTDHTPVAYASWAYLTDEASEGYAAQTRVIQPTDWNAGENPWIINFICPFGGVMSAVRDLYDILPELEGARVRRIKDGKIRVGYYGRHRSVTPKKSAPFWDGSTVAGVH